MKANRYLGFCGVSVLAVLMSGEISQWGWAQTTLTPWGNVNGMRVGEQPVEFEAGLRIVHPDWTGFSSAVKYLQRPRYGRDDKGRTVESDIEGLAFKVRLEDTGSGEAVLEIQLTATTNLSMAGAYFCVELPDTEFKDGALEVIEAETVNPTRLTLSPTLNTDRQDLLRAQAAGARVVAPGRTLETRWNGMKTVLVRRDLSNRPTALNDPLVRQQFVPVTPLAQPTGYQLYIELMAGEAKAGRTAEASFKLKASATVDSRPVKLEVDVTKPGRAFDGIGGNFRLQLPKTDAAVIQYNLENLRVAWGRIALPWVEWDPEESQNPLQAARTGRLDRRVHEAMEMARTLTRQGMPVIVSAWAPPKWARALSQPAGLRGTALNPDKMDRICSSLTDSLIFLKERYGVEAVLFSFNEPETGVEVRQTAAEHVDYLKKLGAHLAHRGLMTKLLLGDTAHGTPAALDFIRPALEDPATHRYLGAVAFHTWRGCTIDTLPRWAEAARQLSVPLLVTETGPDAHLHEYPEVMLEPWFQLQEIELYLRICAHSQPATIMEWQLTTDYSVLWGGGVYGSEGPLHPTQRFWNLKQLGATPPGAFALPISIDRADVTGAAFGDLANGHYAIHIVNRGAHRPAMLSGLPESIASWRRFTTDANQGMAEGELVQAQAGRVEFILPAASYVTLLSTLTSQK